MQNYFFLKKRIYFLVLQVSKLYKNIYLKIDLQKEVCEQKNEHSVYCVSNEENSYILPVSLRQNLRRITINFKKIQPFP